MFEWIECQKYKIDRYKDQQSDRGRHTEATEETDKSQRKGVRHAEMNREHTDRNRNWQRQTW